MKPFGTDDDHIELNWILDRNIRVSFALADNVYDQVSSYFSDDYFYRQIWMIFNIHKIHTTTLI